MKCVPPNLRHAGQQQDFSLKMLVEKVRGGGEPRYTPTPRLLPAVLPAVLPNVPPIVWLGRWHARTTHRSIRCKQLSDRGQYLQCSTPLCSPQGVLVELPPDHIRWLIENRTVERYRGGEAAVYVVRWKRWEAPGKPVPIADGAIMAIKVYCNSDDEANVLNESELRLQGGLYLNQAVFAGQPNLANQRMCTDVHCSLAGADEGIAAATVVCAPYAPTACMQCTSARA